MDEQFASMPITNAMCLCVGGITQAETDAAVDEGLDIDGLDYYLSVADETSLDSPIQVLAKFASSDAAVRFARLVQARKRWLV